MCKGNFAGIEKKIMPKQRALLAGPDLAVYPLLSSYLTGKSY